MDVLGPLRAHGKRNSLQWLGFLCRVYRFIIVSENKGRSSSLMPGNSIMTDRLTRGSRHVKGVFPEAMLPEINNLSDSFPNLITIKSRCRCFPPNDQPEEQILKRHIFEAKDNDNGLVQRLVLYKQSTLEQYAIINKRKTDCKFFHRSHLCVLPSFCRSVVGWVKHVGCVSIPVCFIGLSTLLPYSCSLKGKKIVLHNRPVEFRKHMLLSHALQIAVTA